MVMPTRSDTPFVAAQAPRKLSTDRARFNLAERAPLWIAAATLAALLLAPVALGSQGYSLHVLMSIFLFATLGHAWNLLAGYAGLLSFGQQVFIGLGGFAQALVYYYTPVSIWIAWPVSGLASLAFAWLLCLPVKARGSRQRVWIGIGIAVALWLAYEALIWAYPGTDVFRSTYVRRVSLLLLIFVGALPLMRMRGAYFAIATWLISESVATIFNGWGLTGAGGGMQIKSDATQLQLYYVALALLTVTTGLIWIWMRSTQGLALTAIRDDEDAAQSSGVNVSLVKASVFVASATITGLAAGLYFIDVVVITPPSAFTISWASYIVFVAVAGGMGTVAGPIIGAVMFIMIERLLGAIAGQGLMVLGVLSIALMLLLPRGVMGLLIDLIQDRRKPSPPTSNLSLRIKDEDDR